MSVKCESQVHFFYPRKVVFFVVQPIMYDPFPDNAVSSLDKRTGVITHAAIRVAPGV